MSWSWCFMLLLSLPLLSAYPSLNEVMYAPTTELGGSENEWIELYSNQTYNLSGCTMDGKALPAVTIENYLIIANNELLFQQIYTNTNLTSLSLALSLNNEGDTISLRCPEFNHTLSYDKNQGGYRNNFSLEQNQQGEWKEALDWGGTPGEQNSIYSYSYDYTVLEITEIMPDPVGNDNLLQPLGEWVELYNSGSKTINLDPLHLYDEYDDHKLAITSTNTQPSVSLCSGCYAVIYRNGDNDFELSSTTEDQVRLFLGTSVDQLLQEVSYSPAPEGMSWSRFPNGWYLTTPTPATGNIYTAACDWSVQISTNNTIYQGSDLSFTVQVQRRVGVAENITVKGTIETIFGEPVQHYSPWTQDYIVSSAAKTYSPNLKEGTYQLTFWLESISCADQNLLNNRHTLLLAVNPQYHETTPFLHIEQLYLGSDDTARWGDQFLVKVTAYKGNSTRTAVELWAEQEGVVVSQRSKLNLYLPFHHYNLTLPLQLHPNCANEEAKDGSVTLHFEGLGQQSSTTFPVSGINQQVCKDYAKYIKEQEREDRAKISYFLQDLPLSVLPGAVLPFKLQIINEDNKNGFTAWAYLYRGNTCYSCQNKAVERDFQQQYIFLQEKEVLAIPFFLRIDEVDEGEYKLKVKIIKDGQKTAKELTETLYLSNSGSFNQSFNTFGLSSPSSASPSAESTFVPREVDAASPGLLVYETNSHKSKGLIPYFLLASFLLLSALLIKQRKN